MYTRVRLSIHNPYTNKTDEAEPDMNFIDPIFSVLGQLYTV